MGTGAQSNRFLEQLTASPDAKPNATALLDRPLKLALEYIQKRTRPGNITSTELASIEDFDLDSAALRSLDYRELLEELRDAGHIFVFPAYRYAGDTRGGLEPVRYLVARTEALTMLYDIFEELVQASVNAILACQATRPDPADALGSFLAESSPFAKTGTSPGSPIIITPEETLRLFRQGDWRGLAPEAWLVQDFLQRIRDQLIAKGAAVPLPAGQFLPLGTAHILACFRVSAGYLQKHIDRVVADAPGLGAKIEAIRNEEQSYARKPYSGPVLDYDIRRATVVHGASEEHDAGLALAARIILSLRNRATELQKREWQEYCARFVAEFLGKLQRESDDWTGRIRFFTMRSRAAIHPAIWPLLRHHPGLISQRWETEEGTCFLFCSRRPEHLESLLEGVAGDLTCEGWKLQAIAKMIEQNEHFELLMESPRLRRLQAQLVRRAARGTIPRPVRWLLYLPSFLHRIPQQMSRLRIESRQAELGAKNRLRQSRATPLANHGDLSIKHAAESGDQIKAQLLGLLEDEYFTEGRIATIGDLHRSFPELKANEFARLLRARDFQLLPADPARPGRLTRGSIVLFPEDASLPVYLGRVRGLTRRLLRSELPPAKKPAPRPTRNELQSEAARQRQLAGILAEHLEQRSGLRRSMA